MENGALDIGLGNNATHQIDMAENTSITPGSVKDLLNLEEYADISNPTITDGSTSDFSSLIDHDISCLNILELLESSADVQDIDTLLSGVCGGGSRITQEDVGIDKTPLDAEWTLASDGYAENSAVYYDAHTDSALDEMLLQMQIILTCNS